MVEGDSRRRCSTCGYDFETDGKNWCHFSQIIDDVRLILNYLQQWDVSMSVIR